MTTDPHVSELLAEMDRLHDAAPEAEGAAVPLRRVLGMRVGPELYGADISGINEIIKLSPITFVPGAPPFILGVTSVRGQIVPVVNLRIVLGLDLVAAAPPRRAATVTQGGFALQDKPRVVIVHHGDRVAGLLVDAVTEVYDLRVPLSPPLGAPARGLPIKEGQVMLEDRPLILLHLPSLFAHLEAG